MKLASVILLCGLFVNIEAEAQNFWNLPVELSDTNTSISFENDSTWHMVRGTTKNIKGRAWLDNKKDFKSIRAEITISVASFDTDNSDRDERMREVMQSKEYPDVRFTIDSIADICDPQSLEVGADCEALLDGTLTIRNVSQAMLIKGRAERTNSGFSVQGNAKFKWADFGVEDPSIFIAKLKPEVSITFSVKLEANSTQEIQNGKHS